MSWRPHARLVGCGTWTEAPQAFEIFFTFRERGRVEPDYAALAAELGLEPADFVRTQQVHGDQVLEANDSAEPGPHGCRLLLDADGMTTDRARTALVGLSADCPVLLVADPARGAAGCAHSGWRGTAARIATKLVERMRRRYGSRPANLLAFIGPSIGACCYEVGEEVFAALPAFDGLRVHTGGARDRLDLVAANRYLLREAGVERIADTGLCTCCHPERFPSYRRDGAGCGLFAGVILRR